MQFSTRSLLLVTAFIAIVCATYIGWARLLVHYTGLRSVPHFAVGAVCYIPIWLPFIFIGYAIGRKTVSTWLVIIFLITQCLAVGMANLAMKWYSTH